MSTAITVTDQDKSTLRAAYGAVSLMATSGARVRPSRTAPSGKWPTNPPRAISARVSLPGIGSEKR
ncbi:hypothetical protein [Nocardia sp. CA-120079]|uniref:hypothetical protein n=1 Tax=Nocardia sp. CA-120079 TaxID=3239974 RepID=UPI003D988B7B